jgi:hypothetical protein
MWSEKGHCSVWRDREVRRLTAQQEYLLLEDESLLNIAEESLPDLCTAEEEIPEILQSRWLVMAGRPWEKDRNGRT